MTAIFELPLPSETLNPDDASRSQAPRHATASAPGSTPTAGSPHANRAGRPIVGRMYARLKLAGIDAATLAPQGWTRISRGYARVQTA